MEECERRTRQWDHDGKVIGDCGVTLKGTGTVSLQQYLIIWFSMMNAYSMLMIVTFFAGSTCQKQQNPMPRVRDSL